MALDHFAPRRRRTAFRPELVGQARRLAALGATDTQIAEAFGVDEDTVDRWQEEHAAFRQALDEGRAEAEGPTDDTLSRRAAAFNRGAEKILGRAASAGGRTSAQPARDPTALIALFKHHRPVPPDDGAPGGRVRKDGKSVEDEHKVPELSDLELARRIAFILTTADPAHRDGSTSGSFTDLSSSTSSTGVS